MKAMDGTYLFSAGCYFCDFFSFVFAMLLTLIPPSALCKTKHTLNLSVHRGTNEPQTEVGIQEPFKAIALFFLVLFFYKIVYICILQLLSYSQKVDTKGCGSSTCLKTFLLLWMPFPVQSQRDLCLLLGLNLED